MMKLQRLCLRRLFKPAKWILAPALSLAILSAGWVSGDCRANSVTFVTPAGSTAGGQPVSAEAVFTTSMNTLTITLTNLQANPTSVVQNLSDLFFTLSSGQTTGTLTSSSGMERTVNGNGSFTDGSVVPTGWKLSTGPLELNDLAAGAAGPAHLIIGPPDGLGQYSNANGSIAGNKPHNPFLAGPVMFTLDIPGVTVDSTVSSATFSFGTTAGVNVPGMVPMPFVPEPSSLVLVGVAVAGLAVGHGRRRRPEGSKA
jgi:hypothetical protein